MRDAFESMTCLFTVSWTDNSSKYGFHLLKQALNPIAKWSLTLGVIPYTHIIVGLANLSGNSFCRQIVSVGYKHLGAGSYSGHFLHTHQHLHRDLRKALLSL